MLNIFLNLKPQNNQPRQTNPPDMFYKFCMCIFYIFKIFNKEKLKMFKYQTSCNALFFKF